MSNEVLDEAGVLAKFGVAPALIVDYLTLVGDRGLKGPHGLCGGSDGRAADHVFHRQGKSFRSEHHTKIDRLYIAAGDGIQMRTPGGGGYGDPALRRPDMIQDDILNGYVADPDNQLPKLET